MSPAGGEALPEADEGWRAAARSLLAEPIIGRGHPDLAAVRRRRQELTRWFADELGYRLDATRPGVARLAKLPGPAHQPRGLRTRGGRAFDGRRYAVTCLVLASAEGAGERTTLARMFEDVGLRASAIEGLAWDADRGADRRVFIQAVQAVADLGVLEKAEGDEERFARKEEGGDALYRIDRERLSLLPTAPQPPALAGGPEDVAAETYPDTDDGRTRRRRHRVTRALVEQPIVYHDDLSPEEIDYLRSQRARIERLLAERLGLTLEVRAEGWVAVDEAGELTDLRFPDYGAAPTTALRLCDELRARAARGMTGPWPQAEVVSFVAALAEDYRGAWRSKAAAGDGAELLATDAVEILVAARLARRTCDGLIALAGAGRFAALSPIAPPPLLAGASDRLAGGDETPPTDHVSEEDR